VCSSDLFAWVVYASGDSAVFLPTYALDLPVVGVGLLLLAIAYAMRQAVALHRDAALTI
jgi:hypothetical protein